MPNTMTCRAVSGALCITLLWSLPTHALDLTGAYATDPELCSKVFERKGGRIDFTAMSDMYGSGFIYDQKELRGKMAQCTVRSTKEEGNTVHVLANCASDIMLSQTQFTFRFNSPGHVTRIFPGMEGMELGYVKCPAM